MLSTALAIKKARGRKGYCFSSADRSSGRGQLRADQGSTDRQLRRSRSNLLISASSAWTLVSRPLRIFRSALADARMIIWNGPMGVFEEPPFDQGTIGVARAVAEAADRGATVIVGGGDSVSAVTQRRRRRSNHTHLNRRRRHPGISRWRGIARRRRAN